MHQLYKICYQEPPNMLMILIKFLIENLFTGKEKKYHNKLINYLLCSDLKINTF